MALEAPTSPPGPSVFSQSFWCVFYGSGVIGTLVIYGLLQEKIMQVPYQGVLFTSSAFLVFSNRVFNFLFALLMSGLNSETIRNQAPLWKYLVISLANVAATTCQYEALKYVSFPVQMLGKSFKMMPVMLWGIIISGKRYSLNDWIVAAAISIGVAEFLMTGSISSPNSTNSSAKGLCLLLAFLACDGLTSTFQEKLFKDHKTSKYNQMFYVNVWSAVTSFVFLLASGSLNTTLAFCFAHPMFLADVGMLSASATASQFFIYSEVKEFGALVFAATMNLRQVVSIWLSYVSYGHAITILQASALLLVFSALFYKSYRGMLATSKGEADPILVKKKANGASFAETKNYDSEAKV